jgi:DNA-binding CsgD family transcriptional regulator
MAARADAFVGRLNELGALREALDAAAGSHGRIVMLAGEPGIGKTRTARELARHAEAIGTVLWGHCHEEAGAPPYWPWVQIIRGALLATGARVLLEDVGAGAADIAGLVPEIRALLPELEVPARLEDPAQARFRMFESLRQFIASLCARQITVLVLDDLHWADAPSLRLLEFLASALADYRVLLVGTYRPTELSRQHRLSDTLGGLARVPHAQRINLGGLSAAEAHDFVAAMSGSRPPAWLAASLHAQSEGNPLFLREIVRFLQDQGVIGTDRAIPLTALPPAIRIPEGVREVIGRRLNLLSATCNQVLAVAAAIGRDFAHDVLMRAAADQGEAAILGALDEAFAAHIIEETSDGNYQFAHTLIRVTLYDELRPARRRQLHRTVGAAIEASRRTDIDPVLPELARHFLAAGDAGKALDYATRAGARAEALLAFEDAVQFFQTALDMIEQRAEADDIAHCRLLFRLGEALRKANVFPRALRTLHDAAERAADLREAELCARAALAYEQTAWRSALRTDPPPRQPLQRALGLLDDSHAVLRTQVMSALARALVHDGAEPEARREGERAIAVARQLGDPAALASCLYCLLDVFGAHAGDEALGFAAEALAAAHRVGNLEMMAIAHGWRFMLFMERGEIALAEAEVEGIERLNPRLRQRTYLWAALLHRTMLALMRGQLVEAERLIVRSMTLAVHGMPSTEAIVSVLIFTLRREQGRLAELQPVLSALLKQGAVASVWQPGLALLHLEMDRPEEARAVFEQISAEGFARLPRDGRWLLCMVYLVEVCTALGDAARAAELYELMLPQAGRNIIAGRLVCRGSAERFLGLLCGTMARRADAERHFEAALAMNRRMGAHAPLAHTMHDYAAMLLARGADGDRPRATALLRECLASARQLGLRRLEQRVEARLAQPAAALGGELTSREAEVLRLIAIGRSNADIALVLEISLNTVATHVRNILAKTGCANRTEAAAYAMRHGLAQAHQ